MLRCGICESCITPDLGMEMPGYFSIRLATGVKEELYAEIVYFENEDERAMLLSCDIIDILKEYSDRARTLVAERTGIPFESILLCCTHTHTGGPVETWGDYVHENPAYLDFLIRRLADGAVRAVAAAREVTIAFGDTVEDKLAYYRNYVQADGTAKTWGGADARPYGEVDKQVSVLRIDNADGTPYGMIVNFACHCDCVGGTEYSADYPGIMRETLRTLYGQSFMPVFVNGFCGNINHVDPKGFHNEIPEHYKRMGRMLAADAARAWNLAVKPFANPVVRTSYKVLDIAARMPTEEQIQWAKGAVDDASITHQDRFLARETLRFAQIGGAPIPCPVQVLRVGDAAFYAMPGEIYVEFGKMLKERSPIPHAIPADLSNGCVYYVPIREMFLPTIYEARVGVSNQIQPEGGYIMVDALIAMADEIKD